MAQWPFKYQTPEARSVPITNICLLKGRSATENLWGTLNCRSVSIVQNYHPWFLLVITAASPVTDSLLPPRQQHDEGVGRELSAADSEGGGNLQLEWLLPQALKIMLLLFSVGVHLVFCLEA